MKKLLLIALTVLLSLTMITACSSSDDGEAKAEEKVATYALAGNWNTLQPGHFAETGYYGPIVWGTIFDQLFTITNDGHKGRGAKEVSISEDNTVMTFKLDETAKFSDGEAVTANDWVFSAKLIADPDFSVDYTKLTVLFAGTDEVGQVADEAAFGVKALDDYTLEVTFKEPTSIENFLSTYNCYWFVMPAHCFEGMSGADIAKSDFWNNPVTSGAWTVEEHIPNSTLTLVPNPNYHMGVAKLDKLVIEYLSSSNFASSMMAGSVDYVYPAVDAKQGSALMSDDSINVTVSEYPSSSFFLMTNNELLSEDVRIAIDMAIDKQAIVNALFGEGGTPVESIQLFGTKNYNNDLVSRYNPEAAKAALEASDWNMDETFTLLCAAGLRENLAAMLQKNLEDIGMKVEVQTVSVGTLYGKSQAGECHAITGQGAPNMNPWYFAYNAYISGTLAGTSCTHNMDPYYEELESKYNNTTDEAERLAIVMEYQQYMYDHALISPIAESYEYMAVAKRLTGIDTSLSTLISDNTWEWDIAE